MKIVYTHCISNINIGDVIDFSCGSDLLICGSSFIIDYNFNSKTHMSASVAGRIAKLCNCKKLLLTHFWPETDKILYLKEALREFYNVELICVKKVRKF